MSEDALASRALAPETPRVCSPLRGLQPFSRSLASLRRLRFEFVVYVPLLASRRSKSHRPCTSQPFLWAFVSVHARATAFLTCPRGFCGPASPCHSSQLEKATSFLTHRQPSLRVREHRMSDSSGWFGHAANNLAKVASRLQRLRRRLRRIFVSRRVRKAAFTFGALRVVLGAFGCLLVSVARGALFTSPAAPGTALHVPSGKCAGAKQPPKRKSLARPARLSAVYDVAFMRGS